MTTRSGPRTKRQGPRKETYADATEAFLREADWLSALDAPAVATLRHLAADLDDGAGAATVAQYGVAYRALLKRAPAAGDGEGDELEGALAGAGA